MQQQQREQIGQEEAPERVEVPEDPQRKQSKVRGKRLLFGGLAVLLALLIFLLGWFSRSLALGAKARSLLWAVDTAEKEYYRDVDEDALYDEFFSALSLDPYSEYYTREEYARVLASNGGQGADTGLSLYTEGNVTRIFRVKGNSPAERIGLRAGMTVYRFGADPSFLKEGTRDELLTCAKEHASFAIECGFGEARNVYTVGREEYYVSSVLYRDSGCAVRFLKGENGALQNTPTPAPIGAYVSLPEDTAYIRIDEFYGTAAEEAERCLAYMKERGRSNLVLDLRSNGGGYLSTFQAISSHLMRTATGARPLAATARYRDGSVHQYLADGNDFSEYFAPDAKIWVLADENTASASECLLGSLISYGTVSYGDIFLRKETAKTYGKGIMQSSFTGPQGEVLKLTVAEIFWPNGTSIHGKGVTGGDGAVLIDAPLLPDEVDTFLEEVASSIS